MDWVFFCFFLFSVHHQRVFFIQFLVYFSSYVICPCYQSVSLVHLYVFGLNWNYDGFICILSFIGKYCFINIANITQVNEWTLEYWTKTHNRQRKKKSFIRCSKSFQHFLFRIFFLLRIYRYDYMNDCVRVRVCVREKEKYGKLFV